MKRKICFAAFLTLLLAMLIAGASAETVYYDGAQAMVPGETFYVTHTDNCGNTWAVCTTQVGATCVTNGQGSCYCDECEKSWTVTIAASNYFHTWKTAYEAPTCGAVGHDGSQCTRCGHWHVTSEEIPATGKHKWRVSTFNNSNHTYTCTVCGAAGETEAHTLGLWIKQDENTHKAVCVMQGCDYYETRSHTMGPWFAGSGDYHQRNCDAQGCTHIEREDHVWTLTSTDDEGHHYTCSTCNATKTEAHTLTGWTANGDVYCRRTCTSCNYVESVQHDFTTWVYTDDYGHTGTCARCGGTDYLKHSWVASSYNNSQHTATCSVCNTTKTMAHEMTFWLEKDGYYDNYYGLHERHCGVDGCGYYEEASHVWSEWVQEPDYHHVWCTAEYCAAFYNDPHTFVVKPGNASGHSEVCSMCGYVGTTEAHTFGEWKSVDGKTHQRTCTVSGCGYTETAAHTGGKATCVNAAVCSVCNTAYGDPTGHVNTSQVLKVAATCTTNGNYAIVCDDCGTELKNVVIEAYGHKEVYTKSTEATCTETGKVETFCKECGALLDTSVLPKKEHGSFYYETTEATCTTDGKTETYCGLCNTKVATTLIEAPGHTYEHTTVKCSGGYNRGYDADVCTECGDTINKVAHTATYQDVKLAATCCGTGWYNEVCSECNLILADKLPIEPTGVNHKEERRTKTPATCTEAEVVDVYCTEQGYRYLRTEEGEPATGHAYEDVTENCVNLDVRGTSSEVCSECGDVINKTVHKGVVSNVTVQPTCCEPGTKEIRCIDCDVLLNTESVPALGHGPDGNEGTEWRVTKEPTCTAEGEETKFCATTGDNLGETRPIDKLPHTEGEPVTTKEPTCCEAGEAEIRCTVCNTLLSTVSIPALGHGPNGTDGVEWRVTKEPTCTAEGEETKFCATTGDNLGETRPIDKLPHTEGEPVTTKEPTCCEAGEAEIRCTVCNTLIRTTSIPALGHGADGNENTEWRVTKQPTCTEDGEETKFCVNTGDNLGETRPIDATGHDYGDWIVDNTDPTLEYCVCANCGDKDWRTVEAPVDPEKCLHPNKVVVEGTAPTCTEYGLSDSCYCPDCNETWLTGGRIDPLGHDWTGWMLVAGSNKIEYRTCLRCNYTQYRTIAPVDPETCTHENTIVLPGFPASCEEDGLSDHEFCEDCGTPVTLPQTIPATGHQNKIEIPAVPATPDAPGKTAGLYCGDCGKILVHPQDVNYEGDVLNNNINGIVVTPEQDEQIGQVENNVYTDMNGNVIGTFQPDGTLVDPNGNVVGSLEGDHIHDAAGTHVGTIVDSLDDVEDEDSYIYVDGIVVNPGTGEVIGEVENNVYTDNDGNVIGTFQPDGTLVDPNGQVIGDLDGDKIYDNDGNHVGTIVDGVDEDKYNDVNGTVVTPDGETVLGQVEHNDYTDNDGNSVGTFLPDGTLVDPNGEIIGTLEGDYIYDNDGNHIGTIVDTTMIPGHPDFDLDDYLDEYYTHVEDGEKIRPNIDADNCIIGTEQDVNGEKVIISGAEDYAICPNDQYPLSQWIPTGDGNHVRICTCANCDYSETSACVYFEITVNDVLHKICPICGHFGDEQFTHVKGVKVGGDGHLHELFVREYAEPFGAAPCLVKNYGEQPVVIADSFTVAKSVKGGLIAWDGVETLYKPMPNPGNVILVCMNMNGEFEEVSFMYTNGMIVFQADDHGLYLVITK